VCRACGATVYSNLVCSATLFFRDARGNVLLAKRKNEPYRNQWSTPGGFVEIGETAEEALRREIREELGIALRALQYQGTGYTPYPSPHNFHYDLLEIAFSARANADGLRRMKPRDDVLELRWVSPSRIPYAKLPFIGQRRLLRQYLRGESKK
jgi:ADP-ribose pyrophosphatase YjhB (NUDIX family)